MPWSTKTYTVLKQRPVSAALARTHRIMQCHKLHGGQLHGLTENYPNHRNSKNRGWALARVWTFARDFTVYGFASTTDQVDLNSSSTKCTTAILEAQSQLWRLAHLFSAMILRYRANFFLAWPHLGISTVLAITAKWLFVSWHKKLDQDHQRVGRLSM